MALPGNTRRYPFTEMPPCVMATVVEHKKGTQAKLRVFALKLPHYSLCYMYSANEKF